MSSKKTYTGINIQYPVSKWILEGKKTVETRKYKIPDKFLNQEMALVETPGKEGDFKARIVAIIKFTSCFQYISKKEFYADSYKHCVKKDSVWAWIEGEKWGWNFNIVQILNVPSPCTSRGIVYRKNITI